ncbi:MAG TPA: GNAT family N-acetyltransferase [Candidatus Binataceae bacterium]|nr:GNAT family N-acetyltransferase [Candidatus Binataceae bacterium]
MSETASYSILLVKGESLKGSPLAEKIIALDRKNMEAILSAVGRAFPEDRRRVTLFHPSNRMIVVTKAQEVVGYADYCDDLTDLQDLYISSIQIEATHRGGPAFKLLLSNLLIDLKPRKFRTIKANIQKSNPRMIAIAKKIGFVVEDSPNSRSTLIVFAKREILDSPKLKRLFGSI